MRSQFATSSSTWGGSRTPPMAFTEQGVAMLELKYDGQFKLVFDAIRELVSIQSIPRKRIIGLGREAV